ncbi:unnamed protein product [Amoebophrya sp. A120]|nr:unnamed protein product [Amoebophrya sp. A120]|eukprot:GSA120T00008973001.1
MWHTTEIITGSVRCANRETGSIKRRESAGKRGEQKKRLLGLAVSTDGCNDILIMFLKRKR